MIVESEADLARLVVAELQRLGFDTYEEVETMHGRADVIALRSPLVVVVEVKRTMSIVLMNQLLRWVRGAHQVIGAVGYGRYAGATERFFRSEGFGLWEVHKYGYDGKGSIEERVAPRFMTRRWNWKELAHVRKACIPETRTGSDYAKAGTSAGGQYTPFRRTAKELAALVKRQPGISVRDAVEALKQAEGGHHWANDKSARSSMPRCIERGIVPGVRIEYDGRFMKLFPSEPTASADPVAAMTAAMKERAQLAERIFERTPHPGMNDPEPVETDS